MLLVCYLLFRSNHSTFFIIEDIRPCAGNKSRKLLKTHCGINVNCNTRLLVVDFEYHRVILEGHIDALPQTLS